MVLELIQILEGKGDGFITEDEEHEMYVELLSDTQRDRETLKNTSGKFDSIIEADISSDDAEDLEYIEDDMVEL